MGWREDEEERINEELRQAEERAAVRRRDADAISNIGHGLRDLFRSAFLIKGKCPDCKERVQGEVPDEDVDRRSGQVQSQTAIVACSCGHSVTFAQWQQQNG